MTDSKAPQTDPAALCVSAPICAPQDRPYVLAAAILASALGFIDGTVVAIALPAIRATIGADLAQAQWIHNAYMVTLVALILLGGALGDRFGLARVFGLGIAVFVAASLLCAFAPTSEFLILSRALQGVGAAVMAPGSLALIARIYPREERGRAIGLWAAAAAVTTALGPIFGGIVLSFGGDEMWRWIFAVNLPLGGLAIWLLLTKTRTATRARTARLDMPGATIATLSLFVLAWGLIASGGSGLIWVLLGLGGMLAFLWVEAVSPHPMMPLSLFRARVFSAANLLSFTLYSAVSIMFFFMPMTFIAAWDVTPFEASAAFAPMSVFIALFSARAGRLADRIGPAPLLFSGSLIVGLGYGLMGWLATAQDFWQHILPAMCLVGLGMSLVVAPLSAAVMSTVSDDQTGIASAVNNAITRFASLVSVAAVGGFVTALYVGAGGSASFGIPSTSADHSSAMTSAFVGLAYLSAGLCLVSAALALLTRPKKRHTG